MGICQVLTGLDLGSWADEMDDLPLPGKFPFLGLVKRDGCLLLMEFLSVLYSWYVMIRILFSRGSKWCIAPPAPSFDRRPPAPSATGFNGYPGMHTTS